jgi:hypothetical protein
MPRASASPPSGPPVLTQQCETEPSKVGEPKSTRKTKLIALNEGIRQAIPRHQTRTEGGATWPSRPPTAQPPLALLPGGPSRQSRFLRRLPPTSRNVRGGWGAGGMYLGYFGVGGAGGALRLAWKSPLVALPAARRRRGHPPARRGVHLTQQCENEPSKVGEPKSTRKTKLIALNKGIKQAIPRHQTRTEGGATWPSRPPTAQPPAAWIHAAFQHLCTRRRAPECALTGR